MKEKIILELHKLFKNGDRITNKKLKETIQQVYDKVGWISCKAKGTDITKYGFCTRRCKIRIGNNRVDGVILSTLDKIQNNEMSNIKNEETYKQ